MSFLNRMLASIGIGNAKVDTRLAASKLTPGDQVEGTVFIQGGNVEQQVDSIYLHLLTQYIRESNDHKVTETAAIGKFKVAQRFTLMPNETKEIPFTFLLPLDTPVTIGRTPVWIRTGLDIESAVDPTDDDYVEILPHPYLLTVLEAADQLGFTLRKTTNEYNRRYGNLPFVQEFEFYPGGAYRGRLDEIEMVFFLSSHGVEVLLEVDRRARGLSSLFEEAFDLDERKQKVYFSKEELAQGPAAVGRKLEEIIRYHAH
ncbi:sporulation protein [Paenibacillus gansuensis]|uniref:Sporulation protein n=1 Tax=Paenibacillus gansuensis TaxID=306542 RepID=A0ABW5P6Z9_9BACL